ncbi:MAG TPA: SIMPL domain-containing protein [Chryseolinea sp.]
MRYSILFVFLLATLASFGQETFKGEHFIEVTGSAEMEVEPNEIFLFVRLREFEENRAKVSLEKLDQEFLQAVKAANIDRKNLTLADAGSKLDKIRRKDKDAFREKSYEIKLTSAAELEKFLEKIEPVKIDRLDITRLHHSEMEKFKIDLKVKALQAAQTKASTLLKSIGAEIGKPIMVRDWDQDPVQPLPQARVSNMMYKAEADDMAVEEQIAFRKLKLRAQITAQFEIK